MSELAAASCEACKAGVPALSMEDAQTLLQEVPGWEIVTQEAAPVLVRRFRFKDFATALAFTNDVGAMAEQENHHPDLLTRWGEVEVSWYTHKIAGLHRNDFICAARTDVLAERFQ